MKKYNCFGGRDSEGIIGWKWGQQCVCTFSWRWFIGLIQLLFIAAGFIRALTQLYYCDKRGVYLDHWIDFSLGVFIQFKIEFYVYIDCYIVIILFLTRIKSNSVLKSDIYQMIRSILTPLADSV